MLENIFSPTGMQVVLEMQLQQGKLYYFSSSSRNSVLRWIQSIQYIHVSLTVLCKANFNKTVLNCSKYTGIMVGSVWQGSYRLVLVFNSRMFPLRWYNEAAEVMKLGNSSGIHAFSYQGVRLYLHHIPHIHSEIENVCRFYSSVSKNLRKSA